MNGELYTMQTDIGGQPYVANIEYLADENANFRTAVWTGSHLQMTVMSLLPREEIGLEVHPNIDQFIRVEEGKAEVQMGIARNQMDFHKNMYEDDGVFIPAGYWHNVKNRGDKPLKLSVIYTPPNHAKGTIHRTKEEAAWEE